MNAYLKIFAFALLLMPAGNLNAQDNKTSAKGRKMVIYQLLPRLFGNKNTANVPYGTIKQNGSGKFADITGKALDGLKELSVNYVWYTGVIAHASLTDYSAFGIKTGDADVVKGRAGSPYAIRDYYDVDPDLAVNVKNRMQEFEALIKRTHDKGLKVLIDFVPNHVARSYHSNIKPAVDFGLNDDRSKAFDTKNDFYYLPGTSFIVPQAQNAQKTPLSFIEDGKFDENPAKATGNNVFKAQPDVNDWYETVKLNYGVDYQNGEKKHFDPIPPVWTKMRDILMYWADKGVDGFRCDVAEMVPVQFWSWVIPEIKKTHPELVFIGESYNPTAYAQYLNEGKFDYLYDKVGLYDGLKKLIKNEPDADVKDISNVWQQESRAFGDKMLRFLENHDEERIASAGFAGKPELAIPAMVVTATLANGPVMLYFGQEVGEPGKGKEGFGGDDNRTSIFDYWGVPNHQQWMAGGLFNDANLSADQRKLRAFYKQLLSIASQNNALRNGAVYELPRSGNMNNRMYGYIRYTAAVNDLPASRVMVLVNFDRTQTMEAGIVVPNELLKIKKITRVTELLSGKIVNETITDTIKVKLLPGTAQLIEF